MSTIFQKFAWSALAVTMVAAGVRAQETTVRAVDPQHSEGRMFLTSSAKPEAEVNVGVARVSGKVKDKVGSSPTEFDFTIYPADRQADEIASGDRATDPDTTVISFRSSRVEDIDGHTYRASGELTVTYVESAVSYGPGESYSGPVYGRSRTYSVKREASFDFRPVRHEGANGEPEYTEWIASSTVTGRAFPALLYAVANTSWPEYVNNERCSIPGNVGEDYSGPSCSGDVVATAPRSDVQCVMPTSTGEGYGGEICDGTPLQIPTGAQQNSYTVRNVETGHGQGALVADEVKLVVSLRVGESNMALAENAGK